MFFQTLIANPTFQQLKGFESVNLTELFGACTPPATDVIPMASDGGSNSTYPRETFFDWIVYHLMKQDIKLRADTWRNIILFSEEYDFSDRLSGQIPLESMLILSKLDATELSKNENPVNSTARDTFYNRRMDQLLNSIFSKRDENRIRPADDILKNRSVNFLSQPSIVDAFRRSLNEIFWSETDTENKEYVDVGWILERVKVMNIYVVDKFSPFRGVTLRDGVLISTGSLVDSSVNSDVQHVAYLTQLSHEAAHFFVRSRIGDYNYATPLKDLNGPRKEIRFEKLENGGFPDTPLECGRLMERYLFGMQPDWTSEGPGVPVAAREFMHNATVRENCETPLLSTDRVNQLNLLPRPIPSYCIAGDLCPTSSGFIH